MLMSVVLLTALLWEGGGLSRIEGGILVLIYGLYLTWLLSDTNKIREDEQQVVEGVKRSDFSWTGTAYTVMVIVGLTLAVYSANQLVKLLVRQRAFYFYCYLPNLQIFVNHLDSCKDQLK